MMYVNSVPLYIFLKNIHSIKNSIHRFITNMSYKFLHLINLHIKWLNKYNQKLIFCYGFLTQSPKIKQRSFLRMINQVKNKIWKKDFCARIILKKEKKRKMDKKRIFLNSQLGFMNLCISFLFQPKTAIESNRKVLFFLVFATTVDFQEIFFLKSIKRNWRFKKRYSRLSI